ncbi:MAG: hypothetical protein WC683_19880 [bacterium]
MIYRVQYEMSDAPVSRRHRTLSAAVADMERCRKAASAGGDTQRIGIVDEDGNPVDLTNPDIDE